MHAAYSLSTSTRPLPSCSSGARLACFVSVPRCLICALTECCFAPSVLSFRYILRSATSFPGQRRTRTRTRLRETLRRPLLAPFTSLLHRARSSLSQRNCDFILLFETPLYSNSQRDSLSDLQHQRFCPGLIERSEIGMTAPVVEDGFKHNWEGGSVT